MIPLLFALTAAAQDTDRAAIEAVLEANRATFDACFTLATDDVPWASGHAMISFKVDKKGKPSDVKERNSCLHHAKAVACLVSRVEQLSFDPLTASDSQTVIYPLLFTPYVEPPDDIAKVEKAIAKCQVKAGQSGPAHVKVNYELASRFTKPQSQQVLHSSMVDVSEACLERAYAKMRFAGDFEGKMARTFVVRN